MTPNAYSWIHNTARAFLGRPRIGAVITVDEVAGWAQPGHKACQGRGILTFAVGNRRIHNPCQCATRRFGEWALGRTEILPGDRLAWRLDARPGASTALVRGAVAGIVLAVGAAVAAVVLA